MVYGGTDVPADALLRRDARNNPHDDLLRLYRGKHINRSHDLEYRQRHHVPLLKREGRRLETDYTMEWWVTNLRDHESGPFLPDDGMAARPLTLVHYHEQDDALAQVLYKHIKGQELDSPYGDESWILMRPDLPEGNPPNTIVTESILPIDGVSRRGWDAAVDAVLYLPNQLDL